MRDAFFFSTSDTEGFTLREDGIFSYYETIPGLRKYLALPGAIHGTLWKTLIEMRDEEEGWKEVEDCDEPGKIYCRRGGLVFLLTTHATLRVLLNWALDKIQLKDRVILFQLSYHDEKKEWGHLIMYDGVVRRYECDSVGNLMQQKWKNSTVVKKLDLDNLLTLVRQVDASEEKASGETSLDEGILISYVTNNTFIINTKGPLHPIYDRVVKLTQKKVL